MNPSTRIVANTLASYARLFILALVGVVATPIVLHVLGPINYGIFSVIGGSLAFLMFINGALTTSAQRHIAYSLGKGTQSEANKWFKTSLFVHIILGLLVAAIALALSHSVLQHLLVIPHDRLVTATWLYRFVVLTMVLNIVSTPYQALLMAHESIVAISMINILSALSTLTGALVLPHLPGDTLLWYSMLYCASQCVLFVGPAIYCLATYPESRTLMHGVKRRDIHELLGFSGWNLFGSLAAVIRSQGPAVILNRFIGPLANASYGISIQVNGFASEISLGILRATTSPIVKRSGAGDRKGMADLSNLANKYGYFILWFFIAPVLFETRYCLTLWLRNVPPLAVMFVRLLLIALLIDQLTSGFGASLQATGRIAAYQIVVGSMNCIALPIGYLLLRSGKSPDSVLWAGVGGSIMAGLWRLYFAKTRAGISVREWIHSVIWPATACTVASATIGMLLANMLPDGSLRFFATGLGTTLCTGLILWHFGMNADHRSESLRLVKAVFMRVTV